MEYTYDNSTADAIHNDAPESAEAQVSPVKLVVTTDRFQHMKSGVLRKAEKNYDAQCAFIAHFMVNTEGRYMHLDEALEVLDDLTLQEVQDTAKSVMELMQDVAVPKA